KTCQNPGPLFAKYILILLANRLYDLAYEMCEIVSTDFSDALKESLMMIRFSKKELFSLFASLLASAGKYFLATTKSKERRRNHLVRKIRQLGQTCHFLGKNHFALYD